VNSQAFCIVRRQETTRSLRGRPSGLHPYLPPEGQTILAFCRVSSLRSHCLLAFPFIPLAGYRSGLRSSFPARPILLLRLSALECLTSVGPGLWSGQSGKELVSARPFLHPETERQATEVVRYGSGVLLEHRSLAWFQVPCAEQWLTVGAAQLIPFGRVSSMAQLGRCLQLRKRATSEQNTGR